jgi:hypothetical protein
VGRIGRTDAALTKPVRFAVSLAVRAPLAGAKVPFRFRKDGEDEVGRNVRIAAQRDDFVFEVDGYVYRGQPITVRPRSRCAGGILGRRRGARFQAGVGAGTRQGTLSYQ